MKRVILCFILIRAFDVYAQKPIDELIAVEQQFAKTSKDYSTKKAFLAFVDSNCVGYNQGKQINIFREWAEKSADSSKLTWSPEISVIAASGEMGINSGPWQYSETDSVIAQGHFTTVWKKKNNGEWKAVFDMGIGYPQKIDEDDNIHKIILNKKYSSIDSSGLIEVENNFIETFKANKDAAIQLVIEKNSWININGHQPFKGSEAVLNALTFIDQNIQFKPGGFFVSNSYDLLAVYGIIKNEGKKDQGFLHVWERDNKEWKMLMMVIH